MAKITINDNHIKSSGFGFTLLDFKGNNYIYYYNNKFLQVPDEVAKQFEGRDDINIEYDIEQNAVKTETKVIFKKEVLSVKEIFDLTKDEQINKIKKLGFNGTIPKYEKGRVDLILKLQG